MNEKTKQNLMEWVKDILSAIVIAVVILLFILPTIVQGPSMENTLIARDYLLVSRRAYTWFGDPEQGDICVFQSRLINHANGKEKLLIKRVIGLPGDRVMISDGDVYVNGEKLSEPYTKDGYTATEMSEVTVPANCLFCMGDNRQDSTDSRSADVGFVEMDDVKGKVFLRLFPLSKFGKVE